MSHPDASQNGTAAPVVDVRVTNMPGMPAAAEKQRRAIQPRTIVLTAANPVKVLLAADVSRKLVQVIAAGNPVVLCESESQAEDPNNSVATLPNPEGFLLPVGVRIPIDTSEQMWVTAQAFPAQVSILITNLGPAY